VGGELRRLHHLPGPVRDRADFRLWPVRGLRASSLRVLLPPGARDQGPRARGHGRSATGPSRQEPQLLTRGAPGPGSSPWPPDPLVSRPAALRERPSDLWNTLSYEAAPEVAPRGRTGFRDRSRKPLRAPCRARPRWGARRARCCDGHGPLDATTATGPPTLCQARAHSCRGGLGEPPCGALWEKPSGSDLNQALLVPRPRSKAPVVAVVRPRGPRDHGRAQAQVALSPPGRTGLLPRCGPRRYRPSRATRR